MTTVTFLSPQQEHLCKEKLNMLYGEYKKAWEVQAILYG